MSKRYREFCRILICTVLACCLVASPLVSIPANQGMHANAASQTRSVANLEHRNYIPLREQPFYEELERRYRIWTDNAIGEVVGNSPQETLLNFYAVMAIVGNKADEIAHSYNQTSGLFWNKETKLEIEEIEHLFETAVKSLDASQFPESVRTHLADESAIEIKHLLDYIFFTSIEPIKLFEGDKKQDISTKSLDDAYVWRLPGTPISLTNRLTGDQTGFGYFFSAETTKNAAEMYKEIYPRLTEMTGSKYKTPTFYSDFIHTPGHLVPPKWYMAIPQWGHNFIEQEVLGGETIFQTFTGLATIIIYAAIIAISGFKCIKLISNQSSQPQEYDQPIDTNINKQTQDRTNSYLKVSLILFLTVPLTKFVEVFIDDYLNFTGTPLIIITFIFEILYFSLLVILSFVTLEAIGRSLRERLLLSRKAPSKTTRQQLTRRRQIGLIMPICRTISVAASIFLIYRLLILLGLSPAAVLALSAVPGLAIGLGASKLLGNLIAGLSIQVDQHLRIGELCKVGDTTGFVKKIGLRSIEIESIDSVVTIPNASADDNIIVNYSTTFKGQECQRLSLNIDIEAPLSTWQIGQLLKMSKEYTNSRDEFLGNTVSISRKDSDFVLDVYCILKVRDLDTWSEYIEIKESLLTRIMELISQVELSTLNIKIGFETSSGLIKMLPNVLKLVVEEDSALQYDAAYLTVSEYCYEYTLNIIGKHTNYYSFKDSIDALNQRLIGKYAELSLQIPYPTAVELSETPKP